MTIPDNNDMTDVKVLSKWVLGLLNNTMNWEYVALVS